jgi:hypothetical protein
MLKIAATFCAVIIVVSAFSTSADARWGGSGVRMGGFSGARMGGWRGGRWWPWWGAGAGVALAAATWPYYGGYGYGYDSCVQWIPDYGWVNVCSYPYSGYYYY